MKKTETRILKQSLELRKNDNGTTTLRGYAAVFNVDSDDMGFVEQIKPGAFTRTLVENPDVRMLWNHNTDAPVGRSGVNMTLKEDDHGLLFEVVLPNTTTANDMAELVRTGIVTGMSFGFTDATDKWSIRTDGKQVREVYDLNLFEISGVTFPAYPDTELALRSLNEFRSKQATEVSDTNNVRNEVEILKIQAELICSTSKKHK